MDSRPVAVPSTQTIAIWIMDGIANEEFLLLNDIAFTILRARLRGRLENDSLGRRRVIQARNVDRSESSPNGRNCKEDQALPI